MRIRVGVIAKDLCMWAGGRGLLRAMIKGLESLPDENFQFFIFLQQGKHRPSLLDHVLTESFLNRTLGRWATMSKHPDFIACPESIKEIYQYINSQNFTPIFYYGNNINFLLKRFAIDVVLPVAPAPANTLFPCKKVAYIYDFQHEYYPEFFSAEERLARSQNFAQILKNSQALIVTGSTVASDVKRFLPFSKIKPIVLPLYPLFLRDITAEETKQARIKYTLSKPYFMVCNQFWRHKGHDTLFKAFKILQNSGLELVCTGVRSGSKDEQYNTHLTELLLPGDHTSNIHMLGIIPKEEQLALMTGALGVIQPSLFEGGAGAGGVAEALVYGVPCLVSDIQIHLSDLPHDRVSFFKAGDSTELVKGILNFDRNAYPVLSSEELTRFRVHLAKKMGHCLAFAIEMAHNGSLK